MLDVLTSGHVGGAVLAALAVALGADGLLLGALLVAVPASWQLAQLPAVALVHRSGDPKRITLAFLVPARLVVLSAAAVPFLPLPGDRVVWLTGVLLVGGLLFHVGAIAWMTWLNEILPRERLGRYHGLRLGLMSLCGVAALLGSAAYLRDHEGDVARICAVFAVGALAGLVGALFLVGVPRGGLAPPRKASLNPVHAMREAAAYRAAVPAFVVLAASFNLFAPFAVPVVMLGGNYSASATLSLVALWHVVSFASFLLLSRWSDRAGHLATATVGALALAGVAIGRIGVSALGYPGPAVAVRFGATGFGAAALDLGVWDLQMTLAPREHAPVLFASTNLARGIASTAAGIAGGLLVPGMAAGRPVAWLASAVLLVAAIVSLRRAHGRAGEIVGRDAIGSAPPVRPSEITETTPIGRPERRRRPIEGR